MMRNNFTVRSLQGTPAEKHVHNIKLGENKLGQILHFDTNLKYVDVDFASTSDTLIVMISPLEIQDEKVFLTQEDDEFYEHPEYFLVEIEVDTGNKHVTTLVTQLKHEYFVNIIDIDDACDYDAVNSK